MRLLCGMLLVFYFVKVSNQNNIQPKPDGQICEKLLNFLVKYNEHDRSFIMSGYALAHTLGVLSLAADAGTKKQLQQALDNSMITTNSAGIPQEPGEANYTPANRIYLRKGLVVNPTFNTKANETYGTDVANLDFQDLEAAAEQINSWVKNKTENKITSVINEEQLSSDIEAVIINTLLFQGQWAIPFPVDLTKRGDFYVTKDIVKKILFMNVIDNFEYCTLDTMDAKAIKLPFKGFKSNLFIMLPNKIDGLEDMLRKLNRNNLTNDLNCGTRYVNLSLPKFRIETYINLVPFLESIGVSDIFSPSRSKLPFLTTNGDKVYVSHAIQQAFIEVNEFGVKAAAVDTQLLNYKMLPLKFDLNRTFYFEINYEDQALFSGVYRS